MNNKEELILIPKYEKYMQYMIEVIIKMPRTEKFNIGNEFKTIMYKMLENILYINKVENSKRLYYLNLIDAELNTQRIMIRVMLKNKWIDEKKYKVEECIDYRIYSDDVYMLLELKDDSGYRYSFVIYNICYGF